MWSWSIGDDTTALGLTGPRAGQVLARLGLPALPEAMTHVSANWNGLHLRVRRGFGPWPIITRFGPPPLPSARSGNSS